MSYLDCLQRRSEYRHQEERHGGDHGLLQGGHHRQELADPLHQQPGKVWVNVRLHVRFCNPFL